MKDLNSIKSIYTKETADFKGEVEELMKGLDSIKSKHTKETAGFKGKVEELEGDKNHLTDQINRLVSEKDELHDKVLLLESDKDKLASECDDNKQLLGELRVESSDSTEKIANIEEKLKEERDLVTDLLANATASNDQGGSNKKVLIYINTSNRDMIFEHIAQQNGNNNIMWDVSEDIDSADMLLKYMQVKSHAKKMKKYHVIVLLLGPYDIVVNNKSGLDIFDTINKIVEIISHYTKVLISQSPPINFKITSTAVLNSRIAVHSGGNNISVLKLTEAFKDMLRSKSVGADEYTLSKEGALKCASWLLKKIEVSEYESFNNTEDV